MSVFWKKENLIFFVLVVLISLASFWRAFDINLRADDYIQIWVASNPLYEHLRFTVDNLIEIHPITILNDFIFANLFGYDVFLWQLEGYFLKAIGSFFVALMMWKITGSKRIGFFTGLIYASFSGGLESYIWPAAQPPAMIIIPLCLGIYFWTVSHKEKILGRNYLLALLFFLLTVISDPGRGVIILVLAFTWDLLIFIKSFLKKDIFNSFKRLSVLGLLILVELFSFKQFAVKVLNVVDFSNSSHIVFLSTAYPFIISNPLRIVTNFMYSMGNLLIGWFDSNVFESGHFSRPNSLALIASVLLIIIIIWALRGLFYEKKEKYIIILFFLLWIPIAYFPNWLLTGYYTGDDGLILGGTHHYLTISAVGLACILGYVTAKQRKRVGVTVLIFIIIANIFTANRILQKELSSRSAKLANKLWDQIDKEVPEGEKNSILMLKGGDPVNYELVGSDAIPFGVRRGMKLIEELPIIRVEPETVRRLLCESGVLYYNALRELVPNKEPVPLSHVHAWGFENGVFTNISERERKVLAKESKCKLTP